MKEYCMSFSIDCFDFCFWISTFIVPTITFFIIRCLRPKIKIDQLIVKKDVLKVTVLNKSKFFDVNNFRVEVCAYDKEQQYTYHFEPDHNEFLIIPHSSFYKRTDNTKTITCRLANKSALIILNNMPENNNPRFNQITGFNELIKLLNQGYKVRIRCHAYHSFSGLGKSFEKLFD